MSTSAKEAKEKYAEVRTSKDGRRYVNVSDVLNSPAGRAEIRRQAEHFKQVRHTESGAAESKGTKVTNNPNGTNRSSNTTKG